LRFSEEQLFDHMGFKGADLKIRPNIRIGERKQKESGIDILMAVNIVHFAYKRKYDKTIILSGDGDFSPALRKLDELGKSFEIWSFSGDESEHVIAEFGETRWINGILGLGTTKGKSLREKYRTWKFYKDKYSD